MTSVSASRVAVRGSRRLAVVSAVVVLGLAACGSDGESSSEPPGSVPAAQVIELAAGADGDTVATAGGAGEESAPAAADSVAGMTSRIASIEYSFEGELPALDGPAASWFIAPGQSVTPERVSQLAAGLGLDGEVQSIPPEEGGGWVVGPRDGTAPSLTVSQSSLLDWWYSPGPLAGGGFAGCASAGAAAEPPPDAQVDPADGASAVVDVPAGTDAPVPECAEPQPPAGVPTAAEAEAKATEMFTALGYDMGQYELETYADEWSASVTAWRLLEGRRSPLSMNVGFGGDSAVQWIGGVLAEPERGGDYPRIGAAAGLERLKEQSSGFGMLGDVAARSSVRVSGAGSAPAPATEPASEPAVDPASEPAVGAPAEPASEPVVDPDALAGVDTKPLPCPEPLAATDSATGDAAAAAETGVGEAAPIDPSSISIEPQIPLDCVIDEGPAEPLIVVLTGVREDLTMIWAADDTVWLLPAYTFTSDDGGIYTVNAVSDEFFSVAEPEPTVDDPGTAVTVEPQPAPDEPIAAITLDEAAAKWVGSPLVDVEKFAEELGMTVRVVRQDGEDLAATDDLRTNRVNVGVEGDVVTEVLSIG